MIRKDMLGIPYAFKSKMAWHKLLGLGKGLFLWVVSLGFSHPGIQPEKFMLILFFELLF